MTTLQKSFLNVNVSDDDCPGRHNGVNLTACPRMTLLDFHMNRDQIADNIRSYMMESSNQGRFDPLKIRLRQNLQRGIAQSPYSIVYHRLAEARTRLLVVGQAIKSCPKPKVQAAPTHKVERNAKGKPACPDIQSVHSSIGTSWEHIQTGDLTADEGNSISSGEGKAHEGGPSVTLASVNSLPWETVQNPPQYEQGEWKPDFNFGMHCSDVDEEELRGDFYSWLNKLPTKRTVMDISHETFANGTATPDGHSGFTVSNLRHPIPPRDMRDNETYLHWHETSIGYAYNYRSLLYNIKFEEAVKENRPHSHRPYLRFVRSEDMEELATIFQTNATERPIESIGPCLIYAERIIKHCSKANLPFIVAVNPVRCSPDPMSRLSAKEEVMGYAYVKPSSAYDKALRSSSTGQMEVFVVQKYRRRHVAQSLVDTVLTLCSSSYINSSTTQNAFKWHELGCLSDAKIQTDRLDKIICAIAYLSPTEEKAKWVIRWLRQEFRFEEVDLVPLLEPSKRFISCLDAKFLVRKL